MSRILPLALSEDVADRLIARGFVAGYVGVVGSLLVLGMPSLKAREGQILLFILLPIFVLGTISAVLGSAFHPRQRWGREVRQRTNGTADHAPRHPGSNETERVPRP
jgi:hypothetical protein